MSAVVLVHPDDVNLADAKALAAKHGATIEGNRFVRRGEVILTTTDALEFGKNWS